MSYLGITAGVRTHFSVGQSTLSPKAIVEEAAKLGYSQIAMCDNMNVSGMTELVSACKKNNLDYVIGVSLNIFENAEERVKSKPLYTIKAFAQTEEGLQNIFQLLSLAYSKDRFYYVPRLQRKDITHSDTDGLMFTTGDINSLFRYKDWENDLERYTANHNGEWVVEAVAVDQPYYRRVNQIGESATADFGLLTIVTRPVLYAESAADARDVAQAVVNNSDPNHPLAPKPVIRDFNLMLPDDFADICKAMSLDVNDSATDIFSTHFKYKWKALDMSLPKLAENEFAQLVSLCKKGWSERLNTKVFGETLDKTRLADYKERLQRELKVINSMGFSAYFLLVHYVVNYAKDNEILVGPARGSAAGSLVAYLLKITDVDPLRFGLFFERFLNPDRLDYPDIDLDFMSSRRGEIIDHLIAKFGADKVSGIANYNTLGSASALRDVARVSKLPAIDYECSKHVPKEHGQNVSLEEAVAQAPTIEQFALKYPKQWRQSVALQGLIKTTGQHAAGIVVAGEPIIKRGAVMGHRDYPVVCWDKRVVEDWGLIKLDVLGLSTLDIIYLAVDKLKAHYTNLDLWSIPLDDKATLEIFAKGKTKGVFQFEGGMARNLCREIAVSGDFRFEDIVAINALNRPGPLDAGLTDKYVKIRQGMFSPDYPHPAAEPALKETESVIVYQEQVMQIARDLSGFSMAEADTLRKAIGKKDADLMKTMKDKFIDGAKAKGMREEPVEKLWDDIEGFAAYSFNKSHAVAYSLISYMAAYLKAHHAGAFYAASMSILDDEKVRLIAKEATTDGFLVMPPDINYSTDSFEMKWDHKRGCNALFSPLTAVKNVSAKVCRHIVETRERQSGRYFASYQDFFDAVEARQCNKRAKDNLNKVGAFARIEAGQIDPLHSDRLRDQKELMGALAVADVKPDRVIDISPTLKHELSNLYAEIAKNGRDVIQPNFGKKPKFVVITDKPTFFEVENGKSFMGKSNLYIKTALKAAGLKPSDGYYTHLVKTQPDDKKELSKEEITYYGDFLKQELDILHPPLVILAGTKSIRYLFPDSKGSAEDLSRTVEYDKDNDRNYMFCINPQMIYIKPDKQDLLNTVFTDVAELFDVA